MRPQKTLSEKYYPLWEGGKSVEQRNIKVGFKIRMYVVTQMNKELSQGKGVGDDKQKLIQMMKELQEDKKTIQPEDQKCSLEDYQTFLNDFFQNVDYEDRNATVTMKTSAKFRLMIGFIDVLGDYGEIDEEMRKCQKYCKWKAIDIMKSLKKGEIPHRGGPNENFEQNPGTKDDDLNDEIENMAGMMDNNNNKSNNTNNNNNKNNNMGGGFSNPFSNQGNQGNMGMGGFSNPYGNQGNMNNMNNMNYMNNMNNMNNMYNKNNMNNMNNMGGYNPQINQNRNNMQNNQMNNNNFRTSMKKAKYEPAGPRTQKVVDSKEKGKKDFKTKNPLTLPIPVKYKSVDYYKLVDNIRQNNDLALREFKKNRLDYALNSILDSLEFLSYIDKK